LIGFESCSPQLNQSIHRITTPSGTATNTTRQTSNASWFTRIGKFIFAGAVPCRSPNTDFNHDNEPDYVLYDGGSHQTAVWYMNNNAFAGGVFSPTLPAAWNLVTP
jgi:hypothetical protein